jgi:hypothetical protein
MFKINTLELDVRHGASASERRGAAVPLVNGVKTDMVNGRFIAAAVLACRKACYS